MAEEPAPALDLPLPVSTGTSFLPTIESQTIDFCDLPFEILVKIIGFAEPPDIFRVGQTCSLMQAVFRERLVWYTAIHTIWDRNTVFAPSFGDIYHLPTPLLQRLSLDPYRFVRCIAKAQENSPTQPFIRPQMISRLRLSNFRARRCHRVFLVPGGRYLFTLHRTDLHLWDLRFTAVFMETNPTLLVSTDVRSFSVNPTKDPTIMRLRLRRPSQENGCRYYEMHNLNFCIDPPSVTQISSLTLKSQSHQTFESIDDDCIFILTDSVMTVWNFVHNASVSWDTRTVPQQFFVEDDAVGIVDEKVVAVWKIPDLQPHNSEILVSESPPPFIPPDVRLDIPSPEVNYYSCRAISDWYTGSSQPIWFDLVEGPETSFVRVKLEKTDPKDISTYRLVVYPRSALPKDNGFYGPQMRPCNDSSVLWWISKGRSIKCHVGPTFFDSPIDHDNYVVVCAVARPTKRQFSLCPVTGKFCYVDYERNCITLTCFLPPNLIDS